MLIFNSKSSKKIKIFLYVSFLGLNLCFLSFTCAKTIDPVSSFSSSGSNTLNNMMRETGISESKNFQGKNAATSWMVENDNGSVSVSSDGDAGFSGGGKSTNGTSGSGSSGSPGGNGNSDGGDDGDDWQNNGGFLIRSFSDIDGINLYVARSIEDLYRLLFMETNSGNIDLVIDFSDMHQNRLAVDVLKGRDILSKIEKIFGLEFLKSATMYAVVVKFMMLLDRIGCVRGVVLHAMEYDMEKLDAEDMFRIMFSIWLVGMTIDYVGFTNCRFVDEHFSVKELYNKLWNGGSVSANRKSYYCESWYTHRISSAFDSNSFFFYTDRCKEVIIIFKKLKKIEGEKKRDKREI